MNDPTFRKKFEFTAGCLLLAFCLACKKEEQQTASAPKSEAAAEQPSTATPPETAAEPPSESRDPNLLERLKSEHWKGDLDGLVERRYIRALVLYNKTDFFYDGPEGRGISYEAMREFEKFLNQTLHTGEKPVYIVFVPVNPSELIQRLTDGRGDIAVSNIRILPELQAKADFSDPVRSDARQILVTGRSAPPISSLEDLSGKEVYVRKTSRYWVSLTRLNEKLEASGKPRVILKAADENLEDEDILDMVNAGMVEMTVIDDLVADPWSKIYDGIKVHSEIPLATGDQIAWAVPKNTPKMLSVVNQFVKDHKLGTSFGNTLMRRYIMDTRWVRNNTSPEEMKKFSALVEYFKKYAGQYGFDWLMIAAQAYQESQMDQSRRSPAGAVGVMQMKPSTAAGSPINIENVESSAENNIHAAVKYLNFLMDQYFAKQPLDRVTRGLFAAASYNAGPARVAELRKRAIAEGLDPNRWFNNVELIAAREIGSETVTYVSNIYKYYVAYKLAKERSTARKAAEKSVSK